MNEHNVIEFGMNCAAMAMRSKLNVLGRGEAMTLVNLAEQLVPEDDTAMAAIGSFVKMAVTDQPRAGAALHDFVIEWRGGCLLHQPPETPRFDWQDRMDLA
jgi:hypothetical protein